MTRPDGWIDGQLGSACDIEIGGTPSRGVSKYWDTERVTENAWVSIKDMRSRVITETAEQISDLGIKHSNAKLQAAGTVLLSFKLTIGRVAFAGRPLYTNEAIAGLRPKSLDPDYLYHGLQQWDLLRGVDQAIKGATLNKEKLKKISFIYPERDEEQAKIAEVLSTVDRAIEQTEALIAKQQRIKTGLMQDLLTRGIDEHGNLRSEATHEFKDSPLGRIPVEWDVRGVGNVFNIQLGKMLSKKAKTGRSPYPYLGNKAVQWDYVDLDGLETMDFNESEQRKFELRYGDILVCEGGEVGRTCLWRDEIEHCYYQKAIHRLRPRDDAYLPDLFPRFMRWMALDGRLSDYTTQTSIAHLTKEKLEHVPIAVPPKPEQMAISARLNALDDCRVIEAKHLRKLQALKAGLMHGLLTGDRRVTALLEEGVPA